MKRSTLVMGATVAALLVAAPVGAQSPSPDPLAARLDAVRMATAPYHWLPFAIDAGYAPFALDGGTEPTCFSSEAGGMGVHYVQGVDAEVDPVKPEAMVYELTATGEPRLVAVEYIVPQEVVEDASGAVVALPELFGQPFHKHSTLPLYVLHAWVWAANPEGTFSDFNPQVMACMTMG